MRKAKKGKWKVERAKSEEQRAKSKEQRGEWEEIKEIKDINEKRHPEPWAKDLCSVRQAA
jgi:hypothetical protein